MADISRARVEELTQRLTSIIKPEWTQRPPWMIKADEAMSDAANVLLALRDALDEAEEMHLRNCLMHRCQSHYAVAQLNTTDQGSECGACVRDMWRAASELGK